MSRLKLVAEKYKAANLKVVAQCDKYHQRSIDLDTQVSELKRQSDKLRAEITRLKYLELDCQVIKADGIQCDRVAKVKVNGSWGELCDKSENLLISSSRDVGVAPTWERRLRRD